MILKTIKNKHEKTCILWLLLFLSPFSALHAERGKLISYKLVHSYSVTNLDSLWKSKKIPKFIAPINNPLDVFEVMYETVWHDGTPIKASGIFFLPREKGKAFPMICYHHGTQVVKDRKINFEGEQAICTVFGGSGYMVAFPDYLGLGQGEKTHLYLHLESEANTSIDLLRAVKQLIAKEGAEQSKFLFLTGYSQGGHATLATLKVMQEKYPDEFKVTASAPMSGPYDLVGKQGGVMFHPYSHPGYLPYLIYSYQEVYKCFDDPNCPFKAPYDKTLSHLFDGTYNMHDINKAMPEIPKDVLTDDFLNGYVNDDKFPFKAELKLNSVNDWKPETPVLLCYCKADEQVSYENAIIASANMKARGAKNIKLRSAGRRFGHKTCAVYSSMYTKMYFDSFLNGSKKGRKGPLGKRLALSISKMKVKK